MQSLDDIIYITSKVNEIFATTEITQYYTNILNKSIELSISFPIKEEINLSKFIISMGNQTVISKIFEKEKAIEKYNDTIASGNVGFLTSYEKNENYYTVNIGNLLPKQQIKLNTYFIQMIGTRDISYEFNIMEKYPTFHYKELNMNKPRNKKIISEFHIKTQSKITRLIAPFYDELAKKNSSYEVKYGYDYKSAIIKYIKNSDDIKNKEDINHNKYPYSGKVNEPTFYSSFCILFRTEFINKPILYRQYNPELKETSYAINYTYTSNINKIPTTMFPDENNTISYIDIYEKNDINDAPGLFIFLIDQSGSMNGKSINLVKEALLLFIQSLPIGSYFQFIGFGSDFKKYNNEPVPYTKENVSNMFEIINNLKANMGGTNISRPLDSIYQDNSYSNINLSKNIFLLTDGQVHDRDECIRIITTNSEKFRLHSIGIGNEFDKILIERCGKLGKGSSSFVEDIETINSVVINTLNKSLRPYINNINFNFENYSNEISSSIISCTPKNGFAYQNETINYSFILSGNVFLYDLKLKITGNEPKNPVEGNIIFENKLTTQFDNGDELSKMIVGKALKNNEELIKDKNMELKFAKKYQILSKNTALFAELINQQNQQTKLIKVNLNDYHYINKPRYNCLNANLSSRNNSLFSTTIGSPNKFNVYVLKCCSGNYEKKYCQLRKDNNYSIKKKIKSNNNNETIDISKLIFSQNIIEGSWNENEETNKLINIITLEKFNKIKDKIKSLNKGINERKIIYTILVIYYLYEKCKEKLDEFRLIINKANNFLINNGVIYQNIINDI